MATGPHRKRGSDAIGSSDRGRLPIGPDRWRQRSSRSPYYGSYLGRWDLRRSVITLCHPNNTGI